ncbi:MAG: hypothetical protein J5818_07385 [Eggerthellaceae bacterium]|nr:hypothetical protein [Eggerthellaceae bacterium]
MSESLKRHIPVIVAVSLVGIATGAFALIQVRNAAASMDTGTFEGLIIVIPCMIMLICSLIVAMTAHAIERNLYVTMLVICLAVGIVSMVLTSIWEADASLTALLLANSAEGETITPAVNQPIIVMRNIAAYIVMPTIGCIAGAWLGSRMHPMEADLSAKKSAQAKNSSGAKAKKSKKSK